MRNFDKKLIAIFSLLIVSAIMFVFALIVENGSILFFIALVPGIIARGIVSTVKDIKSERVLWIATIIGLVVAAIIYFIIR